MLQTNPEFWSYLDALIADSEVVIDRPRGTAHPRFPDFIYPVAYGYLKDTASMDGGGIDVWLGTDPSRALDAILCTVDRMKRDSEIKLLIGCAEDEKALVFHAQNDSPYMKALLIRRPAGGA